MLTLNTRILFCQLDSSLLRRATLVTKLHNKTSIGLKIKPWERQFCKKMIYNIMHFSASQKGFENHKNNWNLLFSSVQFSCSVVSDSATPWTAAHQTSLSITNSQSSLKPKSIESVMPSSHLILCRPLLLPPIPPSIRVFSNESTLRIRWPKNWSFSFKVSPTNEHPGLISFRIDWLDCNPRDSQESSPTPQFKSINSSALSFLHSPTLTSIHDHRKNHNFD